MMDLDIIKELMAKLKDEMKYGKDDLAHRLGREDEIKDMMSGKPEVKVAKVIGELPDDEEEDGIFGKLGSDEGEDDEGEDDSPIDGLKARLMKLRG